MPLKIPKEWIMNRWKDENQGKKEIQINRSELVMENRKKINYKTLETQKIKRIHESKKFIE
jgi:hypothetical protein